MIRIIIIWTNLNEAESKSFSTRRLNDKYSHFARMKNISLLIISSIFSIFVHDNGNENDDY